MAKKIIFQKCNFNIIYFLFYIISAILSIIIKYNNYPLLWSGDVPDKKNYIISYRFLLLYTSNISDFLALIPYLIHKKLSKVNKKIDNLQDLDINTESSDINGTSKLIYNNGEPLSNKKRKKTIILYFIIIAGLDFLSFLIVILFTLIFQDDLNSFAFNCVSPLNIIFQFVCSILILKIHFYKLQYFSLFLNVVIFIIILVIDIFIFIKEEQLNKYAYLFHSFYLLFLSIEYSLGKKVILLGFISIYFLFIIRGIIKFVFTAIFSLIMFYTNKEPLINIKIWFSSAYRILINISNTIIQFFENVFLWIIIDRFSPNHIPLALILKEISNFIVSMILNGNIQDNNILGWDLYIRIILYLILIVGVMIHNEIIIINICGLGSDTKYFLDIKVEIEQLYSDTDDPEILKRYETLDEMDDKDIGIDNIKKNGE